MHATPVNARQIDAGIGLNQDKVEGESDDQKEGDTGTKCF